VEGRGSGYPKSLVELDSGKQLVGVESTLDVEIERRLGEVVKLHIEGRVCQVDTGEETMRRTISARRLTAALRLLEISARRRSGPSYASG
jgi:hypothetical protein